MLKGNHIRSYKAEFGKWIWDIQKIYLVLFNGGDRSKLPITIYNAPKFSAGLLISPQVISALAEHLNIVGLKDTSKEDIARYVAAVPKGAEFAVLAGLNAAMDLLGYYGEPPRLPLTAIADSDKRQLEAVLQKEGLL